MRKYGIEFPDNYGDLEIEIWCFKRNCGPDNNNELALGPAGHARKAIDMLWNYEGSPQTFSWTPWAERMLEAACRRIKPVSKGEVDECRDNLSLPANQADHQARFEALQREEYLGLAGCGSSGKSGFCAVWGIFNYLCDPVHTKVFCTSTSLKEAHNRIWGQVVKFWGALRGVEHLGRPVESLGIIKGVNSKGKFVRDRGLELIAGEKKNEKDAISKLKGFKSPRLVFLADELGDLSHALATAAINLNLNPLFQFIGCANPDKFADPFGLLCEPKNGWGSVSAEDEEWESKKGYVLHFDGCKNPNVLAKKDIYPFLMSYKDYARAEKELKGTKDFDQMFRGFWSAAGKDDSIYTEQDLMKHMANQDVTWLGRTERAGFLDADYVQGGDGCAFVYGTLGQDKEGKMVLHYDKTIYFREKKADDNPRAYQIVHQMRAACEKLGIPPRNAGYDASAGAGQVFGAIVENEWSNEVMALSFSGKATDREIMFGGKRIPANERYYNFVTELWYGLWPYLECAQLAGIDMKDQLWKELITRLEIRKTKIIVQAEEKTKMRLRVGGSPNEADAFVGLVELCRTRLKFSPTGVKTVGRVKRKSKWNEWAMKQDHAGSGHSLTDSLYGW